MLVLRNALYLMAIATAMVVTTASHAFMLQHERHPDPTPRMEQPSQRGNPPFYDVFGQRYYVRDTSQDYVAEGIASWYGPNFHGKTTSSGEIYDMYAMTAAHKELPIPCYAQVTNLENGRSIVVKVNDRGPFHTGRIIDLSYTAARKLDILSHGTARVSVAALPPFQTLSKARQLTKHLAKQLYLQLGAFGQQANAKEFANSIAAIAKYPVKIFATKQAYGTIYRVKIGPFNSESEAKQLNTKLAANGISQGMLVPLSPFADRYP